jgi:hypothetical protein
MGLGVTCADEQISDETGANVSTKGVWVPDASKLGPGEVPLYIHIVAKTEASLNAAAAKIQALIDQELGPLIDTRTMIARNRALGLPMPAGVDANGRVKWPEAKLTIGLDSLRNFNVRAKTVGPGVSGAQSRPQEVLLMTGYVREVYPGGDGGAGTDQGIGIGIHGIRHGPRGG